ncbi:hyi [Symbiodinium sp. CCMP2592]|nr:hyi [Symbiodinium sp. CCMP2592]
MAASRRGFSANLAMLFQEVPFLDRLKRARAAGFTAVEISTPELFSHRPDQVASALQEEGLQCVLFNMPAGDWTAGERGLAAGASREDFERSLSITVDYAARLRCPRVHCLAGLGSEKTSDEIYQQNLERAVRVLGTTGVEVLIEPINQRSMPGYHLSSLPHAAATIRSVSANLPPKLRGGRSSAAGGLKLLFDVFHCQIMHGDLTTNLRKYGAPWVARSLQLSQNMLGASQSHNNAAPTGQTYEQWIVRITTKYS